MENSQFPWTPEQDPENVTKAETELQELEKKLKKKEKIKTFIPLIGVSALIGLLIFFGKGSSLKEQPRTHKSEVLISMIPIQKGESINSNTLKLYSIDSKKLSKSQKLQILRAEDAVDLEGKLFAKKDIPPHRPLLWNELTYKKTPLKKSTNPKIYFGGQ